MKIPFVSSLVRNNWINLRSDEVQYLDNWELMGCTVAFLCCFKGTGFENKVVYFELGISWTGPGVWVLLPLCGLAGGVPQKHHQTSRTGLHCLLFLFSFPLALHCRDFVQKLSLIKHLTEISICQMHWNLPMGCVIILLIGWIWWNVMSVVWIPCVAIPGS